MKTFFIYTLGCKVNQYESQQIREFLEMLGLQQAEVGQKAGLVVINSCCVTQTASAKSRQSIQKAQRLHPQASIVVTGCLPVVQTGELKNPGKNVRLIRNRDDLADTLSQMVPGKKAGSNSENLQNSIRPKNEYKIKTKNSFPKLPSFSELTSFKGHTRAFLKIQDGCDGYCTYCIIPRTRPVLKNKPVETVLKEAQTLVLAGHKEIVLTGIFLGAYGRKTARRAKWPVPNNDKLAELLDKMAKIPGLCRIRLSSLEPADVTERLLDTFCQNPNIMPHLHLSVQSGSGGVLKRMCRQYHAEDLIAKSELIKSKLDRPAITGDFIVGFPGESDSDFRQTLELAREIGFSKMHVFAFSSRKDTPAALMQGQVNNEVIKERSQRLRDLGTELARDFRQRFIGETAEILTEKASDKTIGKSERYFEVEIKKNHQIIKKNELIKVKITENRKNDVLGEFLNSRMTCGPIT